MGIYWSNKKERHKKMHAQIEINKVDRNLLLSQLEFKTKLVGWVLHNIYEKNRNKHKTKYAISNRLLNS